MAATSCLLSVAQLRFFKPVDLVYAYGHADESLRDELAKHLTPIRRYERLVHEWHDRKIGPGKEWRQEIDVHLERANIILLLLSPDFLDSDPCDAEMRRAIERHSAGEARVIPVILRPCSWRFGPLSSLQVAPRNGIAITKWPNRDEAFLDVADCVRRAALEVGATGARIVNPVQEAIVDHMVRMDGTVRNLPMGYDLWAVAQTPGGRIHPHGSAATVGARWSAKAYPGSGAPGVDSGKEFQLSLVAASQEQSRRFTDYLANVSKIGWIGLNNIDDGKILATVSVRRR